MNFKLFFLILISLIAFAGNSIFCRLALKQTAIDPASFIAIRLISGAAALWVILLLQKKGQKIEGSWSAALALFVYASFFAYAYTQISAGTGALLLFASIQISMIFYGLFVGERFSFLQIVGLFLALAGLVMLMLPSVHAPPILNAILMIISGVSWGVYSIFGRKAKNPSSATAGNFIRSAPIAAAFFGLVYLFHGVSIDSDGVLYGLASGIIASGLGYVLWYAALKELRVTQAATIQLTVPILAAFGGVIFLGESINRVLVMTSIFIIIGIALVIFAKNGKLKPATSKK